MKDVASCWCLRMAQKGRTTHWTVPDGSSSDSNISSDSSTWFDPRLPCLCSTRTHSRRRSWRIAQTRPCDYIFNNGHVGDCSRATPNLLTLQGNGEQMKIQDPDLINLDKMDSKQARLAICDLSVRYKQCIRLLDLHMEKSNTSFPIVIDECTQRREPKTTRSFQNKELFYHRHR